MSSSFSQLCESVVHTLIPAGSPAYQLLQVPSVLGGFHVLVLSNGSDVRTATLRVDETRSGVDVVQLVSNAIVEQLLVPLGFLTADPKPKPSVAVSETETDAGKAHPSAPDSRLLMADPLMVPSTRPNAVGQRDLMPDFSAATPGALFNDAGPLGAGFNAPGMLVGPEAFRAGRRQRPPGRLPGARFDPIGPGLPRGSAPQPPSGERPSGFEDEHGFGYDQMFM